MQQEPVGQFVRQVAALTSLGVGIVVHDYPAVTLEDGETGECVSSNREEVLGTDRGGREFAEGDDRDRQVLRELAGIQAIKWT